MRVLISRLAIAAAVGLMALIGSAAPAFAHHPVLSGNAGCAMDGNRGILWTIGNDQVGAGKEMTITSVEAKIGSTPYAVLGYGAVVAPGGHANALSVVPGSVTGTITLTVTGTWSNGQFSGTRSVSVNLAGACQTTTTTTPETTTPTTTPDTTTPTTTPDTTTPTTTPDTTTPTTTPDTTTPGETTSTTAGGGEGGTTTTTDGPPVTVGGSTTPPPPPPSDQPVGELGDPTPRPTGMLPFTGGGFLWALFGIAAFCIGLALVAVPQKKAHSRG
jgi:hypothetical protein